MLVQKKTIDNVPQIIHLTADTGTGASVGSLLLMYKKSNPSGYLYCDGSTFDQTKYPALYQYLGSNVLPDYRECVAVGAEQNTTDMIAAHDVYTQGQFKDDQLQNHTHTLARATNFISGGQGTAVVNVTEGIENGESSGVHTGYRSGTTTHGKQKAVFIYIKATSGLTENQQENVLNTINENLSYSTTEHKTGRKWIDGKDTYEITFYSATGWANETVVGNIANLSYVIKIQDIARTPSFIQNYGTSGQDTAFTEVTASGDVLVRRTGSFARNDPSSVTIEYTKTN